MSTISPLFLRRSAAHRRWADMDPAWLGPFRHHTEAARRRLKGPARSNLLLVNMRSLFKNLLPGTTVGFRKRGSLSKMLQLGAFNTPTNFWLTTWSFRMWKGVKSSACALWLKTKWCDFHHRTTTMRADLAGSNGFCRGLESWTEVPYESLLPYEVSEAPSSFKNQYSQQNRTPTQHSSRRIL